MSCNNVTNIERLNPLEIGCNSRELVLQQRTALDIRTKNYTLSIFLLKKYKNVGNPCDNHKNNENCINQLENHENHAKIRNPLENHKNHESFRNL